MDLYESSEYGFCLVGFREITSKISQMIFFCYAHLCYYNPLTPNSLVLEDPLVGLLLCIAVTQGQTATLQTS